MTLLASYNQWMNRRLYDAAATLPDEALAEDRGAFFGSVIGTLNHLVVADTIWLKRFASAADASSVLAALDDTPMPTALDAVPYPALPALRARREWLDVLILRWVDALTPAQVASRLTYTNSKGPRSRAASRACSRICSTTRPITADRSPPCCRRRAWTWA